MKKAAKNDNLEVLETPLRVLAVQLNQSLPPIYWSALSGAAKSQPDKVCLITRKDILAFAESQKLYVNVEGLTEKQKNDKSLIGIPRTATTAVMAEALQRLINSKIEQKTKERQAALKQLSDQKAKEKQSKPKGGLAALNNDQRNSTESPESVTATHSFDFVFMLEEYPADIFDYLALEERPVAISYLLNLSFQIYTASENLIASSANGLIRFEPSLEAKGDVALKEKLDACLQRLRKFRQSLKLASIASPFKQACDLDFAFQIIENADLAFQMTLCFEAILKDLEEREICKADFLRKLSLIEKRALRLESNIIAEELGNQILQYKEACERSLARGRNDTNGQVAAIAEAISLVLDSRLLLASGEASQRPADRLMTCHDSPSFNPYKRLSNSDNLYYDHANVFGVHYDQHPNEEAHASDACDRSLISTFAQFFAIDELQVCDKNGLLALEKSLRRFSPHMQQANLFGLNHFEVLEPCDLVPVYFNERRSFLFEEAAVSPFDGTLFKCLFNTISSANTSESFWEYPNRFLPSFSAWQKLNDSDKNPSWLYDADYARFGKLSVQNRQIFNSAECFVHWRLTSLRDAAVSSVNIFAYDLNMRYRNSCFIEPHANYIETEVLFPAELFPPTASTEAVENTAKKSKAKESTDPKPFTLFPKACIHSHYYRKPRTAELFIDETQSLISAFCEIEAYFDVARMASDYREGCFERLISAPARQDQVSYGLSMTLKYINSHVKVLPTGDVYVQPRQFNCDGCVGRIITHKGHVIKYYSTPSKKADSPPAIEHQFAYQRVQAIEILHPAGTVSQFSNGCWIVTGNNGKRFKYAPQR